MTGDVLAPAPLRLLRPAVVALVVVLVALPVTMLLDPAATAATVEQRNPSMAPDEVRLWASVAVAYTAVLHLLYGALVVWLSAMTLRRKRWARIALTVAVVLATLGSLDSARAGPAYLAWVIVGDVLHLAVIVILWAPRPVRRFFAAAPTS